MIRIARAATLFLLTSLAACRQEAEVGELAQEVGDGADASASAPLALDLLFVIDNSGSMAEEQASLGSTFQVLLDELALLPAGLPSLHVGVISTDVGAGGYALPDCNGDGDNGRLQTTPRLAGCEPPSGAFLSDEVGEGGVRVRNYSGALPDAFGCVATLGTAGCGYEQPLEAMKRALGAAGTTACAAAGGVCIAGELTCPVPAGLGDDACAGSGFEIATCCGAEIPLNPCQVAGGQCVAGDLYCDPPAGVSWESCGSPELNCCAVPPIDPVVDNAGFLRAGAHLAIIFLADEDDCSAADPSVFDPADASLGAPTSFRCIEYGLSCDGVDVARTPATYASCEPREGSYLRHPDAYATFLRSLKPDDQLFVGVIAGDRGPLEVVVDGGDDPRAEPSCTSTAGSAGAAYRLGAFAEAFPDHLVTSICAPDLGDAFAALARRLGDALATDPGAVGGRGDDPGGCSAGSRPAGEDGRGGWGAGAIALVALAAGRRRRTRVRLAGAVR